MDETNLFGQRIYELRKQKQLNQKQLGEAVGLSHKAISTIESGTRGTTIDMSPPITSWESPTTPPGGANNSLSLPL